MVDDLLPKKDNMQETDSIFDLGKQAEVLTISKQNSHDKKPGTQGARMTGAKKRKAHSSSSSDESILDDEEEKFNENGKAYFGSYDPKKNAH